MPSLLIRCLAQLKHLHKIRYLVLIASLALVGVSFYRQPVVKIQVTHTKTSQPPAKHKQVAIYPKTSPYAVQPGPTPIPQITSQPIPKVSPLPIPIVVPPKTVTPAPHSSVPSLKPTATSTPTSTSSGSTTSGSGSTSGSSGSGTGGSSGSSGSSGSGSSGSGTASPSTAYQSSNWSGYFSAISGTKYTTVSASWTAASPTNSSGSTAYDANWIGIGGITNSDLIQIGINNTVTASGQVYAEAFYEMLPSPAVGISSLAIAPGDAISASITESGTNTWVIKISDATKNESFTKTVSYTSSLSSAEWIEEDPSDASGALLPLDDFGTVNFSQALTTANGTSEDLTQLTADNITMLNSSGSPEAVPSAIGSDGASFSVKWQ